LDRLNSLQFDREGKSADHEHHRENLLHPNHITDGRHGSWHGILNENLVRQLESDYEWWFKLNGYKTGV